MEAQSPAESTLDHLNLEARLAALEKSDSERKAALEQKGFDNGNLTPSPEQKDDHADRSLAYWLRFGFFCFALIVNWWWDNHVVRLLWQAGRSNAGFHLSDKVLITLLTSSIANFLGLLTIIAHYLFRTAVPNGRRKAANQLPAKVRQP